MFVFELTQEKHLSGFHSRVNSRPCAKREIRLEKPARDKHSSLLDLFVGDEEKKV
jgi:hypothetical protein